jgi:hypothetical protein
MLTSSACSGSDSDSGSDSGSGSGSTDDVEEAPFLRVDADGSFDVAAGEDKGWLLVQGEPAEVWQIASDGTLTLVAELPDGGDEIVAFGDGAAVTRFDCRDTSDTDCGDPKGTLYLLGPDGSVDHEVPLVGSEAESLEGVGVDLIGASDERVWIEASSVGIELLVGRPLGRRRDGPTRARARQRPRLHLCGRRRAGIRLGRGAGSDERRRAVAPDDSASRRSSTVTAGGTRSTEAPAPSS